jgi:quercetin dioxygenase-like cupin family protein
MVATITTPTGFTTQLLNETEYAEEVRRKIITKDKRRQAVLVCLKAGTCLQKHTSAYDGFITVVEGQGLFILDDQEVLLEPGVFIAMPANAPHAVQADTNLAFLKVVDSHNDWQKYPQ